MCFWQDDLFDVTLCFSGKPYQVVIFHTFSCTFVSMRAIYSVFQSSLACLPQILVSTLSHNLFKGWYFWLLRAVLTRIRCCHHLGKSELSFASCTMHRLKKNKIHPCGHYSEVLVFSRWKANTQPAVRFAHGKPLEAVFSSKALVTLGRLLAAPCLWLAVCHATPRASSALDAAQH